MGYPVSRYTDAKKFLAVSSESLYSRASINNLMLGICEQLVRNPAAYQNPFFAALLDEKGVLLLAAVMTPPHNIILAGGEDYARALPDLISYLINDHIILPGVIGPVDLVDGFVRLWRQAARVSSEVGMYQRIYELRHVRLPMMPPGHFRVVRPEDIEVIAQWLQAFEVEALGEAHDVDNERAERFIDSGKAFVWEREGKPVSMALKTRPLTHSITVSGVYTPPENRRQGYATALVARLSQHLLDSGYEFINLFTDLENPTSNAIYQKVGYHPVCDFRMYKFTKADGD